MAAPRIRPTFEITSELSSREVVAHLEARRERVAGSIVVTFPDESIELVPHPSKVHYWSPQLTLRMAEADGRTRIRGRFAPHPHVWTLYLAVHALGAFGTIGAAMYGISQYMVGASAAKRHSRISPACASRPRARRPGATRPACEPRADVARRREGVSPRSGLRNYRHRTRIDCG